MNNTFRPVGNAAHRRQDKLWAAILIGCLSLAGCKDAVSSAATPAPAAPVQRNLISVPALPVIQDAVFSLSPTFAGKRNRAMMEQVCALARGEAEQARVNEFLRQQGVDASRVPLRDDPLSLLVNGDRAGQATACAAYLATSVLSPVDGTEFMRPVEVRVAAQQQDGKAAKKPGQPKGKAATPPAQPQTRTVLQVDQALLAQVLPIKVAEARADADVFALIAAELQRRPGLTLQEYRQQARELFARLAPIYLQRIRQQVPPATAVYKLIRLDDDGFTFYSSLGTHFDYSRGSLMLRQHGIKWYGDGQLLGKDYELQAAYFPAAVNELLAPAGQAGAVRKP